MEQHSDFDEFMLDMIRYARYQRQERRNISRLGVVVFVYIIFVALVQTALQFLVPAFFPAFYRTEWFLWIHQIVPPYLLGVPLAALLLVGMPKKVPQKRKMTPSGWVGFLSVSFFLVTAGGLISNFLIERIEALKGGAVSDIVTQQINEFSPVTTLLVVVIVAPIFEELLFRKLIVDRLLPYSEAFAILTSGLIFGLVHGNFYQFFYATLLGMFFALVYVRTGKLGYTIVMHMIINFTGSLVTTFLAQNVNEAVGSFNSWGIIGSIYSTALYLVAGCGLLLLILNFDKLKVNTHGDRDINFEYQLRLGWVNTGMIMTLILCLISFAISLFIK